MYVVEPGEAAFDTRLGDQGANPVGFVKTADGQFYVRVAILMHVERGSALFTIATCHDFG